MHIPETFDLILKHFSCRKSNLWCQRNYLANMLLTIIFTQWPIIIMFILTFIYLHLYPSRTSAKYNLICCEKLHSCMQFKCNDNKTFTRILDHCAVNVVTILTVFWFWIIWPLWRAAWLFHRLFMRNCSCHWSHSESLTRSNL